MINAELGHVTSVEEFYKEIRSQQEAAHGDDYCLQHDAITKLMEECDHYMELGTHQGGTAACALLTKPKSVKLVDIDMHRYNKFLKPLAEEYCKENNIKLVVKEVDSTSSKSVSPTDLLLIDSRHNKYHMAKELMIHQFAVRKYIVAHDTSIVNGRVDGQLYDCLAQFCKQYPFEIIERNTKNVGYTVLKRK